jgi:hypothetical protein
MAQQEIAISPRIKPKPEYAWVLRLNEETAELLDDYGKVVHSWTGEEVFEGFKAPSFWENRKYFSLQLPSGLVEFNVITRDQESLQEFSDLIFLRRNPNAAQRSVVSGVAQLVFGAGLAIIALVATLGAREQAVAQGKSTSTIWWGGMLFGVLIAITGIGKLVSYFYWKRLEKRLTSNSAAGQ